MSDFNAGSRNSPLPGSTPLTVEEWKAYVRARAQTIDPGIAGAAGACVSTVKARFQAMQAIEDILGYITSELKDQIELTTKAREKPTASAADFARILSHIYEADKVTWRNARKRTQLHALACVLTHGSCRGWEVVFKSLEDLNDKVLYRDLDPFLYVDDNDEVRFGCRLRFRGLKGRKDDESQFKEVFLYEESDELRLHDPTLPLLALCFEDRVFQHVESYDQLKAVSVDAIRAAGNKFPLTITPTKLDSVIFVGFKNVGGGWAADHGRAWDWNSADSALKKVAAATGYYDRITFYCLRRMVTTSKDLAGLSPGSIKSSLGHSPRSEMYMSRYISALSTADMQGLANGRSADVDKLAPSRGMRWHAELPTSVSSQGSLEVYTDPEVIGLREAVRVAGVAVRSKYGSINAGLKHKDDVCVREYKDADNNLRTALRHAFAAKLWQEQQAVVDGAARDALHAARVGESSGSNASQGQPPAQSPSSSVTAPASGSSTHADEEGASAVLDDPLDVLAAVERHEQLAQQAHTSGVDMGDMVAAAAEQTAADGARTSRRELFLSCCRSVESPLHVQNRAQELKNALLDKLKTRAQIIQDMCDASTLPPSRAHGRPGEQAVDDKCPVPGCDVQGAKATPRHVHSCHRRYLLAELRRLFAKTVPEEGIHCMFARCNVHIANADALGAHVNAHVARLYDMQKYDSQASVKCCVVSEEGSVCAQTFFHAPSFTAHLLQEHGLGAARTGYGGIRDDVVEYCEACSLWLLGDAEDHYAYHTNTALTDMENDPLSCAPPQLGTSRADAATQHARCPSCLFNGELTDRQRWRT